MAFKYFPHTESDVEQMLGVVGADSLEALYADVPDSLKLQRDYHLPEAKSEIEVRRLFEALGKKNAPLICFAGGGAYDHYAPSVIANIMQRSEFLTSYTPYQAEISQGTLQYIFEYQSMMAELTGLDVSNASLYDGATATAEAMLMMVAAARKRNRVVMSDTFSPQTTEVVQTYAKFHGVELTLVPALEGLANQEAIKAELAKGDVAGVLVAQPNYFGLIDDFSGLADACHQTKALLAMNCDPSTLAVLHSPAEWGADIAIGDCQSLGMPLSFGGPYLGYMCVTKQLTRKMPGRIVGGTTDKEGRRAFVLTMQAREQHIRREKATSNICSNQGIMTLYAAIYLSLMGRGGLEQVNSLCYSGAHYLCDRLIATGKFEPAFKAPFLKEFCLRTKLNRDELTHYLAQHGFVGALPAARTNDCVLFAVTEKRSKEEIDTLVKLINEMA